MRCSLLQLRRQHPGGAGSARRRRIGRWAASLVLLWTGSARVLLSAPPDSALYDRQVCLEPTATSAVQAMASLLDTELEDMTGVEFTTTTNTTSGPGIFLLRAAPDLATRYPALSGQQPDLTDLATKGTEAFFLYSPGSNTLFIVGNSDDALRLGTYYYLHQLGWRALLPGPNWTIKPLLSSITLSIDSIKEPSFRQRTFFGTGAFGGSLPLDPTRQTEADWTRWKAANLFGGSIAIAGHAGEGFNTRNAAELQSNEVLRAFDSWPDSHVPYSVSMKPDANIPALQDLYISDRLAAYNPASYAISVEPADGGGFCVCPWDTEHDPVSSQVFGLAKRVADALDAVHPGAMVSLYAYNQHAAVPADPSLQAWLADPAANVYVNVIPYAFQRTGMDGDTLAAAWAAAKPTNRGIYDYWGIPDWSNNLPDQDLDAGVRKLQYWASLGYDGLASESTTSAGAVGLLWYMAGRLMFDSAADPAALRQEFYDLAFGVAAPPMQRMMERWANDFTLTEQELGNTFLDIAQARALATGHPEMLARVNDYARYVQYIRLWFEYQKARQGQASGDPERHAAADALLKFAWQIHDSDMVHTYRMNELIRNRYEPTDTALQADWNPGNASAAGWTWVQANPLTDSQLTDLVSSGVADYATAPNHVPFEQPVFADDLVPLSPDYTLDGQITAQAKPLYGGAHFVFYVKPGIASLDFQFTPGGSGGVTDIDSLWVYDPAGAIVYSNSFGGNGEFGSNSVPVTFTVNTATSGNYRIYVYDPKKSFNLAAERNLPFVLTSALTSTYQIGQKAFFYVPPGTTTVGLYAPGALPVVVQDGNGTNVARSFGDGIGESDYLVPAGQDGRVWSMGNLKVYAPGAWPLNTPRLWSFSATGDQHGMMVPANAPPSVSAGLDATIVAPTTVANLDGTITDDRMSPAPYWSSTWAKISGPGTVSFGNSAAVDTTATFSAPGPYVLRLTATDTGGLMATDEVSIVYASIPPNTAPIVDAGPDVIITLPPDTLPLAGTVTDDDQPAPPALSHWWTEVHGPGAVTFADTNAVDTTATFDTPGTYLLRLTASDGQLAAYDQISVTVIPNYSAPSYQIGDLGTFGTPTGFDYNSNGQSFDSTNKQYSARFRALASATVDRVYQRYVSVDSNTTVQVGIMADDGNGNPSGTFLAATPADLEPAEGMSWAVFTNAVTLQPLQVYHVVTRVTALEAGAVFYVRCSGANSAIRPYDRATDTYMNGMGSSDGGQTWNVVSADPFFTLGYGSNVVAGVGNAEQSSHPTALLTQGGTGKAVGQTFTVTTREVPAGSLVLVSNLTFSIANVNATHDLILRLRRGDGTVLGTITRPAGDIAATMTSYTWPFDGGALVRLLPGESYYLTTELAAGSGTDEYYYFSSIYGDAVSKANTWGGTNACAPIQSGTANNWTGFNWSAPPPYAGRDQFDLWFNTSAQVLDQAYDSVGDGISDLWRQWYFGGDGTSTNNVSCASCDPDDDGILNRREYLDGTDPTSSSLFRITALKLESDDVRVFWLIGGGQTAVVQAAESVHGPYADISPSIIAVGSGNVITNHLELGGASLGQQRFYRIRRVP